MVSLTLPGSSEAEMDGEPGKLSGVMSIYPRLPKWAVRYYGLSSKQCLHQKTCVPRDR